MVSQLTSVEIEQGLKKLLNISDQNEGPTEVASSEQTLIEDRSLHYTFLSDQRVSPPDGDLVGDAPTSPEKSRRGQPSSEIFPARASLNCNVENDMDSNRIPLAGCQPVFNHSEPSLSSNQEHGIGGEKQDYEIFSQDAQPEDILGELQQLTNLTWLPDPTKASKAILPKSKRKRRKKKSQLPMAITDLQSEMLDSDLDDVPPALSQNGITWQTESALPDAKQDPEAEILEAANSSNPMQHPSMKSPSTIVSLYEKNEFETDAANVLEKSAININFIKTKVNPFPGSITGDLNCFKKIPVNPHAAAKALDEFSLALFDHSPKNAVPPEIFSILKEQQILALKKKSLSHPRAQYFCHMCEYHCDNLLTCKKHIKSNRHLTLKEAEELDMTLRQLPDPCQAQVDAIDKLLMDMKDAHGLTQKEIYRREYIAIDLRDCLKTRLPESCDVILYGSSMTGVGLKGCDVNLNLQVAPDPKVNPAHTLKNTYDVIASCNAVYSDLKADWGAKLPVVTFTHTATGFRCILGLNCDASCDTSKLIKEYVQLDNRVGWLCTMLRYWARECNVDKQMEGLLPPHAFDLMVIYFLQQLKVPVLPVLHELTDQEDAYTSALQTSKTWTTNNNASTGFLWVELFRFYSLTFPSSSCVVCIRESAPLTTTKKNWRGRKLAIEDPFSSKRNLARCVSSQKVYDFILSCFKLSFKYFGIPQTANGPAFTTIPKLVGLNFNSGAGYESSKGKYSRANEDQSYRIYQLKGSRTNAEQSSDKLQPVLADEVKEMQDEMTGDEGDLASDSNVHERKRMDSTRTVDSEDSFKSANDSETEDEEQDLSLEQKAAADPETEKTTKANEKMEEQKAKKLKMKYSRLPTPQDIIELITGVKEEEYTYAFKWHCLTGGKHPVVECSICQKEGHLKQNCPDDQLPPLLPLPPPNPRFTYLVTTTCYKIEDNFKPGPRELDERDNILSELHSFIRHIHSDAQLELFGSSCNGFGFRRSDLDICLTFGRNKCGGRNLNNVKIITNLADKLKKCKYIYQVVAIPTAKVPIVKFTHCQSKLECDVSLYNTLAQHNTTMLLMYSKIDPRVRILGYTMKYFAKLCDIGDASRGSLSSYAYTLMVIFFLQQRDPPVIPVLQELYDTKKPPPTLMVDGWNAWYYDSLKKVNSVWSQKGKNKERVGELWIGLLRFYSEVFDFKNYVVSIRQHKPLTRFEKLWNSKSIAIEDPFDLSHNLGLGVSRKMNNYIMKAFIRGRTIFGTPILGIPRGYTYVEDFLFDPKVLTDGPPPNDRCCRACGRIGHLVRDCPRKRGANNHQQHQQQHRENKTKVNANKNNASTVNENKSRRDVLSPRRQRQLPKAGQNSPRHPPPLLATPLLPTPLSLLLVPPPRHANMAGNEVQRQPFLYPMGIIPVKGFRAPPPVPMAPNDGNALRMMDPSMNHLVRPPFVPAGGFTSMPPHVRIRTEAFPPHLPR